MTPARIAVATALTHTSASEPSSTPLPSQSPANRQASLGTKPAITRINSACQSPIKPLMRRADGARPILRGKQREQRLQQFGANLLLPGKAFRPTALAGQPPHIIRTHRRTKQATIAVLQRCVDASYCVLALGRSHLDLLADPAAKRLRW